MGLTFFEFLFFSQGILGLFLFVVVFALVVTAVPAPSGVQPESTADLDSDAVFLNHAKGSSSSRRISQRRQQAFLFG